MTTEDLINNYINVSVRTKKLAEDFLSLSYNQINWRPSDSQWSIGECIEHLIRTNGKYIPVYEKYKLHSRKSNNNAYKQSIMGKLILRTVMPDYKRKMKTPASFNPIGSEIKENIVNDFINQNNEVVELAKNVDPSKLKEKISSLFSKFVKYNIGDSFLIIAYHNLRHLHQAKRVMENKRFPSDDSLRGQHIA